MPPYVTDIAGTGVRLLSLLLVSVTLLPMVRRPLWWIRVWDYPRVQVAAALAIAVPVQAVLLPMRWFDVALLVASAGCGCWQIFRIHPYTRLHTPQVQHEAQPDRSETVTLLVANVLQDNRRADDLLRIIDTADPDIVLTLETNSWWDGQLQALLPRYPHAVRHPLENTYGIHLFSRLELRDIVLRDRVTKDIPSIHACLVLRSGRLVDLHCVHPEPPQIGNDVAERDAELLLVAQEVAGKAMPAVVCGDLNDVAWSHTTRLFQRISGMLDPRIGRGFYPTFHAEYWFARWPLDHVFHHPSFRLARLEVLPYFGSDHFPILVSLTYAPDAAIEQKPLVADAVDRREAVEKMAEGVAKAEGTKSPRAATAGVPDPNYDARAADRVAAAP